MAHRLMFRRRDQGESPLCGYGESPLCGYGESPLRGYGETPLARPRGKVRRDQGDKGRSIAGIRRAKPPRRQTAAITTAIASSAT